MSKLAAASPPLVTVVEYLESAMSRDLLCKFPDNSAFDFDYTQSSIWSPLLPRPHNPHGGLQVSKRLSFNGGADGFLENTKKMAAGIKRKFADAMLNVNVGGGCTRMKKKIRRKKTKRNSIGFSPKSRAWDKVMEAAANYFKKKESSNGHLSDTWQFVN
ncbi:uncharacterized protein LOC127240604 [Andrographis paniculata]|uniref:uncharacterized protein LOC127240604 n=1 Tax=Andrographis paniculata TaxID=175694 RepID=UPI0021E80F70|nr:uncharacterized protein LOC127240604 [Andrographis paniculata]